MLFAYERPLCAKSGRSRGPIGDSPRSIPGVFKNGDLYRPSPRHAARWPTTRSGSTVITSYMRRISRLARCHDSRQTTVDGKYLARDVFAGVACEQDRRTLQIVLVAETTQWRTRRHFVRA